MSNATDMSTPVTRGELREELERFATKADLEIWGGALAERIAASHKELSERIAASHKELSVELAERIAASHKELSAELAGHAKAHLASTSRDISTLDDKYKSLPARVKALEDAGRTPEARRPRRR